MSITSYEFVPSYVIIAILLLDNISKGGACYPTHSPSPKSAPTCCFRMRTGRVARYVNYIIPICPKLCNYRYSFLLEDISKGGLATPPIPLLLNMPLHAVLG